jgi:hypothetical protein
MKRWLPLVVALPLALFHVVKLWDPDVWWHLATGRHIVETRAIPHADPFSFTVAGAPWKVVDWLAELAMYGSWRIAGDAGPTLLGALVVLATLVALALTLRALEVRPGPSVAVLVAVALLAQWRWSMARPLTLGALCAALSLWMVARAWVKGSLAVLWLVPIAALWSVLHPTAVLAPLFAGGLALATLVAGRPNHERAIALGVLGICAGVLAFGGGRTMLAAAASHEDAPLATLLNLEWQRASLADGRTLGPALFVLFALAGTFGTWRRRLPFVLLSLAGAVLAARHVRNGAEAALLAAPLAGCALDRLRDRRLVITSIALAVIPAALQFGLSGARGVNLRFGLGPDGRYLPKETLTTLRTLPPGRLMHDCTFGGWLIWQRVPVWCDGRTVTLYGESDIERLVLPLYQGEDAIEAAADKSDVAYALAREDSDFERALMKSPRWVPLAFDRESALFVRRARAGTLPLPLDDLRYAKDETWLAAHYKAVLADPARRAGLTEAFVKAYGVRPDAPVVFRTIAWLKKGEPQYADELRQVLEARFP